MSLTSADAIERSVHKTNEWLKDIDSEPGMGDREAAWRILRTYLQLIREQLNLDEAAQLSAQLPLLIRGALWEGFAPGDDTGKVRDRQVTRVLRRHVSEREVDDILSQVPTEVRGALHA